MSHLAIWLARWSTSSLDAPVLHRDGTAPKPALTTCQGLFLTALVERSWTAHSHPHAMSTRVVEAIIDLRRRHPRWGPRKLRRVLQRRDPETVWPVPSTMAICSGGTGSCARDALDIGAYRTTIAWRLCGPECDLVRRLQRPLPVGEARCHPLTSMDGSVAVFCNARESFRNE
jgi:hypothetical protein